MERGASKAVMVGDQGAFQIQRYLDFIFEKNNMEEASLEEILVFRESMRSTCSASVQIGIAYRSVSATLWNYFLTKEVMLRGWGMGGPGGRV